LESKRTKEVIIDTYTLLAIVYDEVSNRARNVLEDIRRGRTRGILPITVVYEYIIHWLKGRIPALKDLNEVIAYLLSYFKIADLSFEDYIEAAKIKVKGDEILRKAEDESLRLRRLSIVDSTVIALAHRMRAPILTGDRDLTYVALRENVETIW